MTWATSTLTRAGVGCLCRCRLPRRGQAREDSANQGRLACRHAAGQAQNARPGPPHGNGARQAGADQGPYPCQGRASVPNHQTAVQSCKGPLSRPGQKHGATAHALRAVEPVDGSTPAVERESGISASKNQVDVPCDASRRQKRAKSHAL